MAKKCTSKITLLLSICLAFITTAANAISNTINNTHAEKGAAFASYQVWSVTTQVTNNVCFDSEDGTILTTNTGGVAPFSYLWSNGQTTQDLLFVASGTYTVTVTDGNGSTLTASASVITLTSQISITLDSLRNVSCAGYNTGKIYISVSGGTPNYTYSWTGGTTTGNSNQDRTLLAPAVYTVLVTDQNGCSNNALYTITAPPTLSCNVGQTQIISCNGGNTAAAIVNGIGGVPPYTYTWANGQTTQTATGLTAGTHLVTLRDNNGCNSICGINISQPTLVVVTETHINVSTNGGNDGSINVSVVGGTQPYFYSWSNGATTQDLNGLAAGTYTINVTDFRGCLKQLSVIVTQPISALTVTLNNIAPKCFGGSDGEISSNIGGGSLPYSFLWSNGQTTAALSGLTAGQYTVTVSDNLGATATALTTLVDPTEITIATQFISPDCNGGSNGSVTIISSGGTGNLTYLWSNGSTDEDLLSITAGVYTVTVTDVNGCNKQATVTVTDNPSLTCVINQISSVNCFGNSSGQAEVIASGGVSPFNYQWSDGQLSATATGLAAGTYTATVTDSKSCFSTCQIVITEPTLLTVSETHSDVTNNGGSDGAIDITVTGGTAAYLFLWNNGNTNEDISNLTAGSYTVTVTDNAGCSVIKSVNITQPGCNLSATETHTDLSLPGASDGTITITTTGGLNPLSYLWNDGNTNKDRSSLPGGNYTLTIQDASGCSTLITVSILIPPCSFTLLESHTDVTIPGGNNGAINITPTGGFAPFIFTWSDGNSSEDRTNLIAGTYTVTSTDGGSCVAQKTIVISQPVCAIALAENHTDVSTPGGTNGTINITASGGFAPVTFLWNDSITNEDRTGLSAGTYTVTATDLGNCSATLTVIISQPTCAMTLTESHTNVSIPGGTNGAINITPIGAFAPVLYLWNNGSTKEDRTALTAGTYTVTATDAASCVATKTIIITQPACALSLNETHINVSVPGGSNGSINITAIGGFAPVSYLWNTGSTKEDRNNLIAGTYTVTATDAGLCIATKTIVITQPACSLALIETHSDVTTNGGNNGTINITATGGFAPVTFSWNDGNTNEDRAGLIAGSYTVTATDAGSCSAITTISITQPICNLTASQTNSSVTIPGGTDGAIDVTTSGGFPPITYSWSDGTTTQDRSNLSAGTYSVVITDAANCTTSLVVIISSPGCNIALSETHTNVTIPGGNNGSIDITLSGGFAPVTFVWSDGNTNEDRNNLGAGTYTVTATDAGNCVAVQMITITAPACALSLIETHVNVSVPGGNNGSINITAIGGFGTVTYLWNNGSTKEDRVNLTAGTRTVIATDGAGCTATKTIIITQPSCSLVLNESHTDVNLHGNNNGSINITSSGGFTPVNYLWNNGNTNEDRSSLFAGTYTVTATDAGNCTAVKVVVINQPPCALTINETHTNVSIPTGSNGAIQLTVFGGLSPIAFVWSDGNSNQNRSNLTSGIYTVTATDAGNCVKVETVTITEPPCAITISETHTDITTVGGSDGSITISETGGFAPVSYLWNDGNTNQNRTNLTAGTYTVTAKDTGNCEAQQTVTLAEPVCTLSISETHTDVTLPNGTDGSIDVTVTGNNGTVTYAWSNGATTEDLNTLPSGVYTVTATDAVNCVVQKAITLTAPACALALSETHTDVTIAGGSDGSITINETGGFVPVTYLWNDGNTNQNRSNLVSGTYTVTGTDNGNCTAQQIIVINQPSCSITLNETHTDATIPNGTDGSIDITLTGGLAPVTYLWNDGNSNEDRINLSSGTYTVTATDAALCQAIATITIASPSCSLSLSATVDNASFPGAKDGNIYITPSGGYGPVTYLWNNGSTNQNRLNQTAGVRTVTATDSAGCTATLTVTITEPPCAITISETHTDITTVGGSDGSITISETGGFAPVSYLWNDGNTNQNRTNLTAGTYTVTAKDTGNCEAQQTVTLAEPVCTLSISETHTDVTLPNGTDGSIDVTVTGNNGTVTYAWSNGATTEDLNTLPSGVYTVTATDAVNCVVQKTITLTAPACALALSETHTDVTIAGGSDGSITINETGGFVPVTYLWNDGNTNQNRSNLVSGTYTVTGTDNGNCTAQQIIVINQPSCSITLNETHTDATIPNGTDGSIDITLTGGLAPVTYLWNDGNSNEDRINLSSGTYTVTATDAALCQAIATITIASPSCSLSLSATVDNASFPGAKDGNIYITPSGGYGPVTYLWNNGSTNQNRLNQTAGVRTVTATDSAGCTATLTVTITEPPCAITISETHTDITTVGGSDGSITISETGGFAPVSYLWNDGNTNQNRTNLTAGTYTVTAKDTGNCEAQQTVTLAEPVCTLSISETHTDVTLPNGTDGSIDVTVTGNNGTVTYAWSNGSTTEDLNTLPSGVYTVTATDAVNCVVQKTITLTAPACALALSETHTDVTIAGGSDGSITINETGGFVPVTYLWNDGNTNQNRSNLVSGTYTVTGTDNGNCTAQQIIVINQPSCSITLNETHTDATIPNGTDGSIDITLTGGLAPVTYLWNDGNSNEDRINLSSGTYTVTATDAALCQAIATITIASPSCSLSLSATVDNASFPGAKDGNIYITPSGGYGPVTYLWNNGSTNQNRLNQTAGVRTVTATDSAGCTATLTVTITEPPCAITISETHTDITTVGGSDGSITISETGGFAPVSYLWNDGNTNQNRTNLTAGTYTVTAKDTGNCEAQQTVTLAEPVCTLSISETHTDVTLPNGTDGSIDVTVTGNNGTVTYAWSNGSTTEDLNTLPSGVYTVTATDAVNCVVQKTITLTAPACALALSETHTDVTIAGGSDGSITINETGGFVPVTYLWNDGNTNQNRSNLVSGTYTVTGTDNGNCTAQQIIVINQPSCSITLNETHTDATIPNGTDGSIDITLTGGLAPVTYLWNDGNSNEDRINLSSGTYTVTATDAALCQAIATITIASPSCSLSLSATVDNASFPGAKDGNIYITPSGGYGPVTYLWNNGSTNQNRLNQTAGVRTVTATDSAGCTATLTVTITEPPCAITISETHTDITTVGGSDGSITISETGGFAPVSYLWNDGNTNQNRTNLTAGTYTVTAKDTGNCEAQQTVTLAEPVCTLSISETHTDATIPNGTDGSIDITLTGGLAPVTYLWNDGNSNEDRINLSSGTYTVTATDAALCQAIATITIASPSCSLSLSATVDNASFPGAKDGNIYITPSGGYGPVTYLWNNGSTNQNRLNQTAGVRTVTATDSAGCTATLTVTITEPPCAITISETHTDITTVGGSDGSITISETGGFAPVSYLWNDGNTNQNRTNLTAGTYTVTAKDTGNCEAQQTVTLAEPVCTLSISETHTDVTLPNGTDGSIDVTVTGNNGTVTYAWSNGATTEDLNTLPSGVYTVTATDAAGCTSEQTVAINEPGCTIAITAAATAVSTVGGSDGLITLTTTGANGLVDYLWNDGDTNENRSNLSSGTYTVTATDGTGCIATTTATVEEPVCTITLNETHTDATIPNGTDGSIDITLTGGLAPVTYLWNDGNSNEDRINLSSGTYTVTATDAALCQAIATITIASPSCSLSLSATVDNASFPGAKDGNIYITPSGGYGPVTYLWNNGSTNQNRLNQTAGVRTVTATDSAGCTATLTVTITEPPCAITISETHTDITTVGGSDGSITISETGGFAPVSYLWNDGNTNQNRTNLTAGTYTVTAKDTGNCEAQQTVTLAEPVCTLSISETHTDVTLPNGTDGSIDVTVTGNNGTVTYAWSNGATTEDLNTLPSGVYTVTATDAAGCTSEQTVAINEPGCTIAITAAATAVSTVGGSDGLITLTTTGANGLVDYLWNDGDTNENRSNLSSGTYTVTATDGTGCIATTTATVEEPVCTITLNETHTDATIPNGTDGSIDITLTGGLAPVTYLWNDGNSNEDRINLSSGTYTVTATDAALCQAIATITIASPSCSLSLSATVDNASFPGAKDGNIYITPSGGYGPVTYLWNNGSTNQNRLNQTAGVRTVTATDSAGCTATLTVTITEPPCAITISETHTDITTVGGSDGSITISETGGFAPVSYLWNDGNTNQNRTNLTAGTYTVTAKDTGNCEAQQTVTLAEPVCTLSISETHTDVTLPNGTDGSIDVTVTGNNGTVTYAWSNGATTEDLNTLPSGVYTVTATDAAGCTSEQTVAINEPGCTIAITAAATAVSTVGGSDGLITLTTTGANGLVDYLWNDGDTNENRSNLSSGTYTVTATDGTGCIATTTATVEEPVCTITLNETHTDATIPNGTDGSIDITLTGGLAPVTYLWNDGNSNEDRINLSSGTYTVTATDAALCQAIATITIASPSCSLSLSATVDNASFPGAKDGNIYITPSGGYGPVTYLWNNGSTNQNRLNQTAGVRTVTATDSAGCTATLTVTITEPPCAITISETHTDITTVGGSDGSITISETGGFAPVSYLWNDGNTNQNRTNLTAGTYTVTAKDTGNCEAQQTVTLAEPVCTLSISETHTDVTLPNGTDGSIDVTVTGNNGTVTYAWSNGATTEDLNTLPSGVYTVTATDAAGCTSEQTVAINEPGCTIAITAAATAVSTVGGSDGLITLTTTGANGLVDYLWNDGDTNENRSNLSSGTYTVTATDGTGCIATTTATVEEPVCTITLNETHTDATIPNGTDGSIDITLTGGLAPVTYLWNDGNSNEDRINLSSGTYTVTATDAALCQAIATITIASPSCSLSLSATVDNASFPGAKDGNIYITPSGGYGPVTYLWNNGSTNQNRLNQTAGVRTVTATDSAGCTATLTVTITEPPCAITISETHTDITTVGGSDGSITISETGGFAPVSYLWNDGNTNQNRTNLTAGTYTVTAKDTGNCEAQQTVTLAEPVCTLSISETHTDVTLPNGTDGSIDVTVTGNNGTVTYAWSNGATTEDLNTLPSGVYTVTATDAAGCTSEQTVAINEPGCTIAITAAATAVSTVGGSDGLITLTTTGANGLVDYLWNDGDTNENRSNLSSGTYTVTATDGTGCIATTTATVEEPVCTITLNETHTDATIPNGTDGSIDITLTGGLAPVTYLWNDGNSNEDRINLSSGTYTVTATDAALCQAIATITIASPSCSLSLSATVDNASFPGAKDGNIYITPSGGYGPVTYLWNNGSTNQNRLNQTAGVRTVTATDSAGCTATLTVTITEPPCAITISETHTDITTVGGSDGSITISETGGFAPVSYLWNDGNTNQNRTNLTAGTYTVTAKDTGNCEAQQTVTLAEPVCTLSISETHTDVTLPNGTDGSIDVTVTGNNGTVTYAWSNGATTEDLNTLPSGVYTVTATDAAGCTSEQTVAINELYNPLLLSTTVSAINCNGNASGIDAIVSGGIPPYLYIWNNGSTLASSGSVASGFTYTVTVTDSIGLEISATTSIPLYIPLNISISNLSNAYCGINNGAIELNISGGAGVLSYLWNDGNTNEDRTGLIGGIYSVTVTDAKNCSAFSTFTILSSNAVTVSLTQTHIVSCFNGADGEVASAVSGGNQPYMYAWSDGQITPNGNNLESGIYTLIVTDNNGCTASASITLASQSEIILSETHVDVSAFGATDASIDITVTGGVPSYTYEWNDGATVEDRSLIGAGTYTLTVTDLNGCIQIITVQIANPVCLLDLSVTMTPASIHGAADGAVLITTLNAVGNVNYLWSNGATTQDLIGIVAGIYTVIATDASGCTSGETIIVSEPNCDVNLSKTITDASIHGANDGAIDITVSNYFGALTYLWNDGASVEDRIQVIAGLYTVTVTDEGGCTKQINALVEEPACAITIGETHTNASLHGASDGSITIVVGTYYGTLSYAWSNGAFTKDLLNVSAGTYTVTVTDQGGCTNSTMVTITEPPCNILLSEVHYDATVYGAGDGFIDLTVSNAYGFINYQWSNNEFSEDIYALYAGIYTVTVTDEGGCTATISAEITQPACSIFLSESHSNPTVHGASDGSIDITVSSANGTLTFQWNDGAFSEDRLGIPAGTYTVVVTDGSGCSSEITIVLTDPACALAIVYTKTNVTAQGANDGTIDVTVNNAFGNIFYTWNDGYVFPDRTGLSVGNYTLTVVDGGGCFGAVTVTIGQGVGLNVSISSTDVKCFNGDNGKAEAFVSNNAGQPSYLWSNGKTTKKISALTAGIYTVTVTDGTGASATASVTIYQPQKLLGSKIITPVLCNGGNNGAVDITVNGGVSPYSYSWDNGATTQDLSNLTAGLYKIVITDNNGCVEKLGSRVVQPKRIRPSGNETDVTCFGGNDGSVVYTITGGIPPYTYLWNDGVTTRDRINLFAGLYTLTITDSTGCLRITEKTIEQPLELLVSTTSVDPSTPCSNDGAIQIVVSGGTLPYTYNWSDGATTQNRNNLIGGTYDVTVTDKHNCIITASVNLAQGTTFTLSSNTTPVNCFNGSTGAIALTINGGTSPYSYIWSNGATVKDIANLTAGTYTVAVNDASGCSLTKAIVVDQPQAFVVTETITNLNCFESNDGSISCNVTGGTSPYTYQWSNGSTVNAISGLNQGTYSITVLDVNGCSISTSYQVSQPSALNLARNKTNTTCNGSADGSVVWQTTGGTPGYSYNWSDGSTLSNRFDLLAGTYNVTVTDANGCTKSVEIKINQPGAINAVLNVTNQTAYCIQDGAITSVVTGGIPTYSYLWSNGTTIDAITGLSAGTYSVLITDANGCTATSSATVNTPDSISLSANLTGTCSGSANGAIDLTVLSGTPAFTYLWSTGSTLEDLSALSSGTYTVTVIDQTGCSKSASFTISTFVPITISASITNVSCNKGSDGSIDCAINGGNAPYSYVWSNGDSTEDISLLGDGIYTVTITDAYGCSGSDSFIITEPTKINVLRNKTNVSCFGGSDGSVVWQTNGGTPGYSYTWSDGSTLSNRFNLYQGTYTITVTDANGCTNVTDVNINQPAAIVPSLTVTNQSGYCTPDGSITAVASGGVPTYSFIWSNGQSNATATGLSSGAYTVTVSDIGGCSVSASANVTGQNAIIVSAALTPTCIGSSDGAIDVAVTGGFPAYTFIWNDGNSNEDRTGLPVGLYTVTVQDNLGCSVSNTFQIQASSLPVASALIGNVTCKGAANGAISLQETGTDGPYTYLWNNGSTIADQSLLSPGTYTVTMFNNIGCSASASYTITEPSDVHANKVKQNVTCAGGADGSLAFNVTGGTLPYTYLWSNGATVSMLSGLTAGDYTVTITDANGCELITQTNLSQPAPIVLAISATDATSVGNNDGTATVNVVSGGSGLLSYLWSSGATLSLATGLSSGSYVVTVTDSKGCTASSSVDVNEPLALCDSFMTGHAITYYNPGAGSKFLSDYLDANFATVFNNNLVIGCTSGFTISLTSAAAVKSFLPSTGTTKVLTQSYINPLDTDLNNALAAQTATLALNIAFDLTNPAFAPSSTVNFRDLIVTEAGPFYGYTVQQVFDEGNSVLGGCGGTNTAAQIRTIMTVINSSWNLGIPTNDGVGCPATSLTKTSNGISTSDELHLNAYPNPTRGELNLSYYSVNAEPVTVSIFNVIGEQVFSEKRMAIIGENVDHYQLNKLPKGVYSVQFKLGNLLKINKIVVQ